MNGALEGEGDAIRARALRKEYDDLVAVNDLDLRIGKGMLYGMFGPNGSGKTTVADDRGGLRFQVVTPSSFSASRHQPVFLKFDPDFMRFFDKATGKAIHGSGW